MTLNPQSDDIRFLVDAFVRVARVVNLYDLALDPTAPPLSQEERYEALNQARQHLFPDDLAEDVAAIAGRVLGPGEPLDMTTMQPCPVEGRSLGRERPAADLNRVIDAVVDVALAGRSDLTVNFYPGHLPPVAAVDEAADVIRAILDGCRGDGPGWTAHVRIATWAVAGRNTILITSTTGADHGVPGGSHVLTAAFQRLEAAGGSFQRFLDSDGGSTVLMRLPMRRAPQRSRIAG